MSSLESLPLHSRFRARVRLVCITLAHGSIDFEALRFNSHAVYFCDSSTLPLSLVLFVCEKLSGSLRVYSQNCTCKRINERSCMRARSGGELYDEARL